MINELNDMLHLPDMDLLFQVSGDLVCLAGNDGFFKKINPMVSQTLGYSEQELFSSPIDNFVHPEDREVTVLRRQRLKESIPLFNFENRYVTKSGEIVWLSWTSVPVPNHPCIFAIAKNITHKKELEEDRNRLVKGLYKLNYELKQSIYTIAHDLRSPAGNILTGLDLLDEGMISDPETETLVETLKASGRELIASLEGSLSMLISQENNDLNLKKLSLSSVFNEVLLQLNSIIKNTQTTISVDFSKADEVTFNKNYLKSIFLNLLTNSIKYTLPSTFPTIDIRTEMLTDYLELRFVDQGQGFDMSKVKDKIFGFHQRFHEYESSKGIGLYLVFNYLTHLGGKIRVESHPNQGAAFIISFKRSE